MNKLKLTALAALTLMCGSQLYAKSPKSQKWFASEKWMEGADLKPAVSIDIDKFAAHYKAHPNRWKKVFELAASNDLETMPLGLTLIDDNIKMNVQEYTTRPTVGKKLLYERHDQYIDVQCVISGEELQGKGDVENADVVRPYNTEKDIAMYNCKDVPFYIIGSREFTIFFPDEVHTTNYGFGERTKVRKVVFKVKYN